MSRSIQPDDFRDGQLVWAPFSSNKKRRMWPGAVETPNNRVDAEDSNRRLVVRWFDRNETFSHIPKSELRHVLPFFQYLAHVYDEEEQRVRVRGTEEFRSCVHKAVEFVQQSGKASRLKDIEQAFLDQHPEVAAQDSSAQFGKVLDPNQAVESAAPKSAHKESRAPPSISDHDNSSVSSSQSVQAKQNPLPADFDTCQEKKSEPARSTTSSAGDEPTIFESLMQGQEFKPVAQSSPQTPATENTVNSESRTSKRRTSSSSSSDESEEDPEETSSVSKKARYESSETTSDSVDRDLLEKDIACALSPVLTAPPATATAGRRAPRRLSLLPASMPVGLTGHYNELARGCIQRLQHNVAQQYPLTIGFDLNDPDAKKADDKTASPEDVFAKTVLIYVLPEQTNLENFKVEFGMFLSGWTLGRQGKAAVGLLLIGPCAVHILKHISKKCSGRRMPVLHAASAPLPDAANGQSAVVSGHPQLYHTLRPLLSALLGNQHLHLGASLELSAVFGFMVCKMQAAAAAALSECLGVSAAVTDTQQASLALLTRVYLHAWLPINNDMQHLIMELAEADAGCSSSRRERRQAYERRLHERQEQLKPVAALGVQYAQHCSLPHAIETMLLHTQNTAAAAAQNQKK